jgi:hypothetical protein
VHESRFIVLSVAVPGESGEDTEEITWLLVSSNNRPLGRGGVAFSTGADCRDAVASLRRQHTRVTKPDDRTYPLSSYSYMILPIGKDSEDARFNHGSSKRQTLVDFLYYAICTGQKEMGPIGYSPLPVNLVQAGFDQIQKLKVADPAVEIDRRDVKTCNNPTFDKDNPSRNRLAEIAPKPAACDKVGAGPCGTTTGTGTGTGGSGSGSGGSGSGGTGGSNGATPGASTSAGPGQGAPNVDPDTGQVVGGNGTGGTGGDDPAGVAAEIAGSRASGLPGILAPLAVLELLAVLIIPVFISRRLGARRRSGS